MPESETERQSRILRELEGKNVAHYSVLLSGWIETRMERDRTLVALSAAAIGLLVTILTTVGVKTTWMVALYIGAFTGFLLTIVCSIHIYQKNSEKLEHEIRGIGDPGYKAIDLKPFDRLSFVAFLVGVVFAISIGITSAIFARSPHTDAEMTADKKSSTTPADSTKSLEGIEKLAPKPPAEPPSSATPPVPAGSGSSSDQSKSS
jgi:hypothetical protein